MFNFNSREKHIKDIPELPEFQFNDAATSYIHKFKLLSETKLEITAICTDAYHNGNIFKGIISFPIHTTRIVGKNDKEINNLVTFAEWILENIKH